MSYTFTVDRKQGFLHIKVAGQNTAANVRAYLADVVNACTQHGCSNVLIEENLEGPSLKFIEVFDIASMESQKAWPAVRQVAFVDTNKDHNSSLMDFAETVAVNRGMYVRVFADVHEAEAWMSGPADEAGRRQVS